MKPLAIVTGVGPGPALHRPALPRGRLPGGDAGPQRRAAGALADELPDAFASLRRLRSCGASRGAGRGGARAGAPKVAVHNAVGGAFANFLDVDPAVLERNFQVNVMALMHLGRWAAPRMEKAGGGALIVTGNTSAERGRANFAGFRPHQGGAAHPGGIHGAHDGPARRPRRLPRHRRRDRSGVAAEEQPGQAGRLLLPSQRYRRRVWHLAHQAKSAWSFRAEIRPYGEVW
jgi:NAD(P)-dependent dehydrogenase (short-subunit alcohol dehydrogenase family)